MNKYKVCVVMSTYNGVHYIEKQISSILNQQNVDIVLYIRDDGSIDGTPDLLNKLSSLHKNIIIDVSGNNLGFANSFHRALIDAPEADFYAFSDQDDYWFPNKIESTIELIKDNPVYALAFQNSILSDYLLRPYAVQYLPNRKLPNKETSFFQSAGSGFLMLFHKSLRELALRVETIPISYDMFMGTLAYYFGRIQYSFTPVALHRRLSNSVSNGTSFKVLKHRIQSMFVDNGVAISFSSLLLTHYSDMLAPNDAVFLTNLNQYRKSIKSKYCLIRDSNLTYPGFIGFCMLKFKILINKL